MQILYRSGCFEYWSPYSTVTLLYMHGHVSYKVPYMDSVC